MAFLNQENINMLLQEVFYVVSVALALFIFGEAFQAGIVSAYINLNLVLLLWLVVGILVVASKDRGKQG